MSPGADAIAQVGAAEIKPRTRGNEIERTLYTIAIGCMALSLMVILVTNFSPHYSRETLHALLSLFRKAWVLISVETIVQEAIAILICVPLLKLTRTRLTWWGSIVLSLPIAYLHALSFCHGFDARLLLPTLLCPFIFMAAFRIFRFWRPPSLVDDISTSLSPVTRTVVAACVALQFAILCFLLAGVSFPFKLKIAYVAYLFGSIASLYALLRPSIFSVVGAAIPIAINAHLLMTVMVPFVIRNPHYFWCSG